MRRETQTELQLGPRAALEMLELGKGCQAHAETVRDCVYLALELRRHMEPGGEMDEVIADGCAAIRRVYERMAAEWILPTTPWNLAPGEVAALRDAIGLCEQLQAACSQAEVGQAALVVARGLGRRK